MCKHDERACKLTLAAILVVMNVCSFVATKLKIPQTMTLTAVLGTVGFTLVVLVLMIEDAIKALINNIKTKKQVDKDANNKEHNKPENDEYYDDENCNYYEKKFWHDHNRKLF